ncbi:MAG: electron transfer flavoprotein subunit beta/FixA family protein [Deltaproteobacteria bacterium]|nr:MAG: electron transfer flavoprotein subunit beta/FixA family protein [Deltaproteobacteria bacterium]
MRIVVCAKEVLDPDAVNNYALAGRLVIGDDGKTLTQTTIPRLMNAYDEQAIEAALRLRDAGAEVTLCVVSAGAEVDTLLKHAAALGADEIAAIPIDASAVDHHATAALLAAYIRSSGGADLVLCGRQASDDDQGVVPALIGESLGMPVVTIARALELRDADGGRALRVTRVTPDGDEIVEVGCPALVTISNELGEPRYPTTARKLAARRMKPTVVPIEDLGVSAGDLEPRVTLARQFVPTVDGSCEFIEGASPAELAKRLIERLREDRVLP